MYPPFMNFKNFFADWKIVKDAIKERAPIFFSIFVCLLSSKKENELAIERENLHNKM